jgi:protein TonB
MVITLGRRNDLSARYRPGTGRYAGIAFVAALHLCLVYFLVAALGILPAPRHETVFEVRPIPKPADPKPPEAPTVPNTVMDFFVPPPVVPVTPEIDFSKAPTGQVAPAPVPHPGPVVAAVVTILPRIDLAHSAKPDYPAASRRALEHGKVTIAVLVDASGAVGDARIDTSSGFPRLDQAALDGVRRHYRFTPGTADGKPAAMWEKIVVVFELKDAD